MAKRLIEATELALWRIFVNIYSLDELERVLTGVRDGMARLGTFLRDHHHWEPGQVGNRAGSFPDRDGAGAMWPLR